MSTDPAALPDRVSSLRKAFDDSFVLPPPDGATTFENLLAIRIAGLPYALRLRDIRGLHVNRSVTPLPSTFSGFLGVTALRGNFLPVYDLRVLLGHPAPDAPRWLVVAAAAPVALTFDAFDAHLRIPCSRVQAPAEPGSDGRRRHTHLEEIVDADGARTPVLHLASVCDQIRKHTPSTVAQS